MATKGIERHIPARSVRSRMRSRRGRLLTAALVLGAVYAGFFLRRFPLLEYYDTPLLDLGKIGGYDLVAGSVMGLACATVITAHVAAWRAARHLGREAVGLVIAVSAAFQAILALVYPIVAADVYNYVLQGRLLAVHGLNPLVARPADAAADPWLAFSAFPFIQLAYGPLWAWLAAATAGLAGDNLLAALLGFKALAIAANLANCRLIYQIAMLVAPARAVQALVLYAWSPLVLFETVANAHNDGLVATPLLLAVWLVLRGGSALAAPALVTAAALVKYAPLVLLPTVTLGAWPRLRSRRALLVSLALAASIVLAAYLPFWQGAETLAGLRRQAEETTTSAASLVIAFKVGGLSKPAWLTILRPLATAMLLILLWWRRPRRPTDLPAAVYDGLLAQLLIATFWFQPWYLVPLIAAAAASVDTRRAVLALVFAASATASYLVYFYLWTTPWWGTLSDARIQALAAAVVYLPPLALLGWWWARPAVVGAARAAAEYGTGD